MTSLKWVSSTETGSTGLKPARLASLTKASGMAIARMPNGFADLVPRQIGARSIADDDEVVRNPQFLGRDRGAVNLDLIGPGRRPEIVGETDLRDHKAVLARELASHLGDSRANLVARRQQRGVELFAQNQFDLEGLELLLDP